MPTLKQRFAELLPWQHRAIIGQFVKKEVVLRYRGSALGGLWSLLSPLIMLAVYTVAFEYVFRIKWPVGDSTTVNFALNVYGGLLLFNWFAEVAGRAPRLMFEQPQFISKMVFPLPILAWVSVLSSAFQMLISMVLWLIASWISGYAFSPASLLTPLAPLLLLPWLLGLAWIVASVGVYLRDVQQFIPVVITGLMFLSPVLYPATILPEFLFWLVMINPLSTPIEIMRALNLGTPAVSGWIVLFHLAGGILVAAAGLLVFRRLSRHFSDYI